MPKFSYRTTTLLILAVFAVFISGSKAIGYWSTSASKVPRTIEAGEYAGTADPGDIRGSYSFSDTEAAFGVPVDVLAEAFGIPEDIDPRAFQNKALEDLYPLEDMEIGNGSVKLFVSLYTGIPYDYESAGDLLPDTAVRILVKEGKLSDSAQAYLETHTLSMEDVRSAAEITSESGAVPPKTRNDEADDSSETPLVKGKTIFQEVLDWGVSQDDIEAVLGQPMGHPLKEIRGFCQENGLEFQSVKSELQTLVDTAWNE